jgi:hypothetical protein
MRTIKHRVFEAPVLEPSLTQHSLQEKRRSEAEAFLNEIGGDRLVFITESGGQGGFAVVVWYYAE